jgi:hypothetical protein
VYALWLTCNIQSLHFARVEAQRRLLGWIAPLCIDHERYPPADTSMRRFLAIGSEMRRVRSLKPAAPLQPSRSLCVSHLRVKSRMTCPTGIRIPWLRPTLTTTRASGFSFVSLTVSALSVGSNAGNRPPSSLRIFRGFSVATGGDRIARHISLDVAKDGVFGEAGHDCANVHLGHSLTCILPQMFGDKPKLAILREHGCFIVY